MLPRFTIGDLTCTPVSDVDQGARNVLLIESPGRRILVDTGAGSAHPGNPGRLVERLAAAGIEPASIDAVILSHADFDHIGGAVEAGRPVFPRADHVILRTEVAFWRTRPERLRPGPGYDEAFRTLVNTFPPAALETLRDVLHPVDPGAEVAPGITLIPAPGHTPGNAVVRIARGADALLVAADLFYDPANISDPGWVAIYDHDPATVVKTRQAILAEASANRTLLMLYHLPFPGLGRVTPDGAGWSWTPETLPSG
jgi:glyoxylase-like metal-dependent hydrolase (beta-lactamase superfamily II)